MKLTKHQKATASGVAAIYNKHMDAMRDEIKAAYPPKGIGEETTLIVVESLSILMDHEAGRMNEIASLSHLVAQLGLAEASNPAFPAVVQ